jgi:hypothetical protein
MIVVSDRVSEKTWNGAMEEADHEGTIFQSTYWADYVRTVYGDHPIYLLSKDRKGGIDGLLLIVQSCYGRYPALNPSNSVRGKVFEQIYRNAIGPIFGRMLPYVLWQNGPVIPHRTLLQEGRSSEQVYSDLIKEVFRIAEARNYYAVKFARPSYFADPTELLSSLGFEKRKMGTILVDLQQSPKALWERIDRIARRNISKTEPNIEIVEVSKLAELKDFYDLHIQATRRLGIKTYPFSHYASLWEFFYGLGKIVAFTLFLKEKPIGASICLMHQGTIHEYAIADSDYARSNRIYAVDTLKWHIIKWAHDRNMKYFDLSGIDLYKIEAGDEKARNIYRFKSKWGGNVVESHDYWKTFQVRRSRILDLFLGEGEGCHT